MNRKQFILVLLALAIIGGAGLVLLNRNKQSWSVREAKVGDKVLPNFRFNDVALIHVKSGVSDFNVERKDGFWRVRERGDYAANYPQIKDLLIRIRDLKVVQADTLGPSQFGRVDLESPEDSVATPGKLEPTLPEAAIPQSSPPRAQSPNSTSNPNRPRVLPLMGERAGVRASFLATNQVSIPGTDPSGHCGTLLEFKDASGKLIESLLVGKRHLRPGSQSDPFRLHGLFDGCYIRLPADPQTVLLISDELAAAAPEAQAWLNRDFFKMENIKSVSLISTNGANLWSLMRDGESRPWFLSDSKSAEEEELDTAVASHIAEMLPFLTFVDVMKTAGTEKSIEKPTVVFIETFDHFFYTLKVGGKRLEGDYPVAVSVTATLPADEDKLRDKLAKEQALTRWVYLVESTVMEPILRDRAQLAHKKAIVSK